MMSSEYIIEVSEADFQQEVILYSNTIPVVVDLWAEWCQPCHVLTPILEKLVHEARGAFRLAKVDADQAPNLTMQLNIRSLPTVKAFHRSMLVSEFSGLQTEGFVRDFLRKIVPTAGDLELERALGLLNQRNLEPAILSFRRSLKTNPDNTLALLGLAKALLIQGDASAALSILTEFPAGKEFSASEQLLPLAQAISQFKLEEPPFPEDDLGIAFRQAIRLVTLGNHPAAADGLLDILRQDKNYLKGQVRAVMVGLLLLMGDENPETRKYRSELSSVLF